MSHNYFLDTIAFIEQRLDSARLDLKRAEESSAARYLAEGRVEVLTGLRAYVDQTFAHKLPRRLYKHHRQQRRA